MGRSSDAPFSARFATSYNPQSQSRLYSQLPAELRNHIFHLALLQYPDETRPYAQDTWWYRPGHTHRHRISSSLLLTCKRTYLETHLLAIAINPHTFWMRVHHAPLDIRSAGDPRGYFVDRMSAPQRAAVSRLHVFTQQDWLEDGGFARLFPKIPDLRPSHLTLTIRATDWWNWESRALALDPRVEGRVFIPHPSRFGPADGSSPKAWGNAFRLLPADLESLEIELETLELMRAQVERLMHGFLRNYAFATADGGKLVWDPADDERWVWRGTAKFRFQSYAWWKRRREQEGPPEPVPEVASGFVPTECDGGNWYYVVKSTWRKKVTGGKRDGE